jgi:hypothetical protein
MLPSSEVFFSGPGSGVLLKRRFFLYSDKEAMRVVSDFQVGSFKSAGGIHSGGHLNAKVAEDFAEERKGVELIKVSLRLNAFA